MASPDCSDLAIGALVVIFITSAASFLLGWFRCEVHMLRKYGPLPKDEVSDDGES